MKPVPNYLKETEDLLREHNLKVTKPRLKILKYLRTHHNHPTAATIFKAISGDEPAYRATVYNTLNKLVDAGIVIEIKNSDDSIHYDYFVEPHFHIICKQCDNIADVYYPDFEAVENRMRAEAEKQTGYVTSASHLEIFGICPECQKKNQKKKS
ncbi:transcriptional repressor [Lactobacillus sp. M0403]|uniref:Fur family transcriptional regulator n=1 Tax=Lactobacillus TaxID=1578 RepID=UPI00094368D2|nr:MULTISPECIES: Fur family transcriptional regulator [Lactobacillus]MBC6360672.1 transcriptional repressor [Lactobacillus apis]MBH9985109.1 transcriptional repressor [Lactobacillus sp. M0390]MBI0093216.1 transcriptional repressor [Lactobacillus sp. M0403]RMC49981.1 transcriptional repressor [Lactobacillus sp. ESL0263]